MIIDTLSVIATLMTIVIFIGVALRLGSFAFDLTGDIVEVLYEYACSFVNRCLDKISKL